MQETIGIDELKAKITEFGEAKFKKLVQNEFDDPYDLEQFLGLSVEIIDSEREYEYWIWTWKIHQQYYQLLGEYDSYGGVTLDSAMRFFEVRPIEKMITVYEKVK